MLLAFYLFTTLLCKLNLHGYFKVLNLIAVYYCHVQVNKSVFYFLPDHFFYGSPINSVVTLFIFLEN